MSNYYESPEYARIAAAMCRQRAEANRRNLADPASPFGSAYMAEVYDACAERWDRKADGAKNNHAN